MSIVALLLIVLSALFFSYAADGLPDLLWGWIYLPKWLLWSGLLSILAWCMDGE